MNILHGTALGIASISGIQLERGDFVGFILMQLFAGVINTIASRLDREQK
jgi:hypothetical protein